MSDAQGRRVGWTFLTNHARVLTAVARNPATRVRDIAALCHLTERAVHAILNDLEEGGYLKHSRVGRRNVYEVSADAPLRHPADAGISLNGLLALLGAFDPGLSDAEARAVTAQAPDGMAEHVAEAIDRHATMEEGP